MDTSHPVTLTTSGQPTFKNKQEMNRITTNKVSIAQSYIGFYTMCRNIIQQIILNIKPATVVQI